MQLSSWLRLMDCFISLQLCYLIRDNGGSLHPPPSPPHTQTLSGNKTCNPPLAPGRGQMKGYHPTDRLTAPQPTWIMNKISPWALTSLSDPLRMTLPVPGLLSELVCNHGRAVTSESGAGLFSRFWGQGDSCQVPLRHPGSRRQAPPQPQPAPR